MNMSTVWGRRAVIQNGSMLGILGMALRAAPEAVAEEIAKLKLAMFSPSTEMTWVTTINPWANAVNAAGKGVVEVEKYPNGALGRALPQQAQMVLDGVADIAFVIPGVTPGRFPDNEVMDLPGLFGSLREATLVYTALIQQHVLRGFENYHVIGAMATSPFEIDSRSKVTSLTDRKGKKIRVTNASQALTLKELGAVPILMPVDEVPEAIERGTIDGSTEFPGAMYDFGIDRVTRYDFFLNVGVSSLTLLMNRKKFMSLSPAAQTIIRRFGGYWYADLFIKGYGAYNAALLKKMNQDPHRVESFPTVAEEARAQTVFSEVITDWEKRNTRNSALLARVRKEIDKVRAG
ncbi:MAG: TRAP transporter substrate-binding protein DctP [Proteobacteria bacterium]|nr:TRAP transporter substrate-binding protein DctP [Pseudomonadota bacterium]